SSYKVRVEKPLPVDSRHRPSLSHGGSHDRFSRPTTQLPLAVIARSRGEDGSARRGAALGSGNSRSTAHPVVFALPCSPYTASTGRGMSPRRQATRKPRTSGHSSSATLRNTRRSVREPPRTGKQRGNIPLSPPLPLLPMLPPLPLVWPPL